MFFWRPTLTGLCSMNRFVVICLACIAVATTYWGWVSDINIPFGFSPGEEVSRTTQRLTPMPFLAYSGGWEDKSR